jgi:hypothetical protein
MIYGNLLWNWRVWIGNLLYLFLQSLVGFDGMIKNRVFFSQQTTPSMNAFILKIAHIFHAWTCTTSSLECLC